MRRTISQRGSDEAQVMTPDDMQEWMRSYLRTNGSLFLDDYAADVENDLIQVLESLGEDDALELKRQAHIAVLWWRTLPSLGDWGEG